MCRIPHALGRRAYGIHQCGRKKDILSGALSCFSPPSLPPLLFTIYQCDKCLFCWGRGGLWLSCQVFLVIGALSRLPTVEAPACLRHPTTIYIARQLLTVREARKWLQPVTDYALSNVAFIKRAAINYYKWSTTWTWQWLQLIFSSIWNLVFDKVHLYTCTPSLVKKQIGLVPW